MTHQSNRLAMTLLLCAGLLSCAKKQETIAIGEMRRYDDPFERFNVMYPGDWVVQPDAKRVAFFSSEDAKSRFIDPTSTGPLGATIVITIQPQDTLSDVHQVVQASKDEIQGAKIDPDESVMFSERPAVKYGYAYGIDAETNLTGYKVFALSDSMLYTFTAEGFNDRLAVYQAVVDSAYRSVHLFRPKTSESFSTGPSTTLTQFSSDHFDMQYPDNFESNFPSKKKESLALVEFKGYRADCTIRVDVLPAKKNTVDKIFNTYKTSYESSGLYRVRKSGGATIGGENFMYIDLAAKKQDADSRAYFAVKNDKLYYVFMSWHRPESEVYLPVFENSVKTIKLKA